MLTELELRDCWLQAIRLLVYGIMDGRDKAMVRVQAVCGISEIRHLDKAVLEAQGTSTANTPPRSKMKQQGTAEDD